MAIHVRLRPVQPLALFVLLVSGGMLAACGSSGSEAQRHGVGAACTVDKDCTETGQRCLAFKGGYCGIADCTGSSGCPTGSACVVHSDGHNYCFLTCLDKSECNRNRGAEVEANCSANVTFTEGGATQKACVPPSG